MVSQERTLARKIQDSTGERIISIRFKAAQLVKTGLVKNEREALYYFLALVKQ